MVKNGPKVCKGIPHCPRHLPKSTNFGRTSKRYWRGKGNLQKKKHIRTRTFVMLSSDNCSFLKVRFLEGWISKSHRFFTLEIVGFGQPANPCWLPWRKKTLPEIISGALNPTKPGCQTSPKKETNIKIIKHLPKFPSISDLDNQIFVSPFFSAIFPKIITPGDVKVIFLGGSIPPWSWRWAWRFFPKIGKSCVASPGTLVVSSHLKNREVEIVGN